MGLDDRNESPTADFVGSVRARVRFEMTNGAVNVRSIARSFGLGVRTLQRRLKLAGVRFSTILLEERAERVRELRDGAALRPHEIASAVGYSDARSLRRLASKSAASDEGFGSADLVVTCIAPEKLRDSGERGPVRRAPRGASFRPLT